MVTKLGFDLLGPFRHLALVICTDHNGGQDKPFARTRPRKRFYRPKAIVAGLVDICYVVIFRRIVRHDGESSTVDPFESKQKVRGRWRELEYDDGLDHLNKKVAEILKHKPVEPRGEDSNRT